MFNIFRKNFSLMAPIDGEVIDLSDVPDQVFSERLVGDGAAINSTGDLIVAPAEGTLTLIFRTNHAFAMALNNGIEVLVHIGLDTVELNGRGFERIATEGQFVKAGDPIIKIDRQLILDNGCSLVTPIIITNGDLIKELKHQRGNVVKAGADEVVTYKMK